MRCLSCHTEDTRVIDTRVIEDGSAIRRRRECERCHFRYSTIEEVEILTLTVDKVNGAQEPYNKEKLTRSVQLPLQKRPITPGRFKRALQQIEQEVQAKAKKDHITSHLIGEIVMKHLKKLDKIAYIRFASVYRSFEDVDEFAHELKKLTQKPQKTKRESGATPAKVKK